LQHKLHTFFIINYCLIQQIIITTQPGKHYLVLMAHLCSSYYLLLSNVLLPTEMSLCLQGSLSGTAQVQVGQQKKRRSHPLTED